MRKAAFKKEEVILVFAGPGNSINQLKKESRSLGIGDRTRFLGYIPDKKIPEIFCLSDTFVMPALYEAQSLVTYTAISYGLPVLVARSGALPEIAEAFPSRVALFSPEKIQSLTAALEQSIKRSRDPGVKTRYPTRPSKIDHLETLINIYQKALQH